MTSMIRIGGINIEYQRLTAAQPRPAAPTMVFLHEGLGSVSMWRDFPKRLVDACGCEGIVYSRVGYGHSDPAPHRRTPEYMHQEALERLPALLDALAVERPLLFGHSDGGSIALIHAGLAPTALSGVIVLAPHLLVEEITVAGIRAAVELAANSPLEARLARHHSRLNARTVFRNWHEIWLAPEFRDWNIEPAVAAIECPILAIQGVDDEYASMLQIDRIAELAAEVELVKLADCRHSPHKDQRDAVVAASVDFIGRLSQRQA